MTSIIYASYRHASDQNPFTLLLPQTVVVKQADHPDDWVTGLHPEEQALIDGAVPNRQREFTAGRNCARAAMRALGWPKEKIAAICIGSHREPLFPSGLIGSITHSGEYCAAALTREDGSILGMGIDAEANKPMEPTLEALLMHPDEQRHWQAAVPIGCHAGILMFSLNEAFFKAVYSRCRRYLEFSDVWLKHVSFGGRTGRVNFVAMDNELTDQLKGIWVDGRYTFDPDMIYSAVTLGAA